MAMTEDPEATQEFDPFRDEDQEEEATPPDEP